MLLEIIGHTFQFEMENLVRVFFPHERIRVVFGEVERTGEPLVRTEMHTLDGTALLRVSFVRGGRETVREEAVRIAELSEEEAGKRCELRMGNLLYGLLGGEIGYRPLWGILTGVRPIKLLRRMIRQRGEEEALNYFDRELRVSEPKRRLALDCEKHESVLLDQSRPDSFSLYVSIPFCPTRCAYCSFVSHSVEQAGKLIPRYHTLLLEEIAHTGRIARELGLRLETVYIGGGTPTTLSAEQMASLLRAVSDSFDMTHLTEWTVEAGRPDTITQEKLRAIKEGGVTRISINPQTMSDRVLENIGRRHTAAQTLEAFAIARAAGFENINMDLIAGLPGDTLESFEDTMQKILALSPESVTVHVLSMKKSARLVTDGGTESLSAELAAAMVEHSIQTLYGAGFHPYYLYRQSKMLGNLENVGWSKPGFEGRYNAYIMDETHSILACGAGAVTKLRQPGGDHLVRIFNYKFPYEYCNQFEEMLTRKKGVREFYEEFGQLVYPLHLSLGGHQPCGAKRAGGDHPAD